MKSGDFRLNVVFQMHSSALSVRVREVVSTANCLAPVADVDAGGIQSLDSQEGLSGAQGGCVDCDDKKCSSEERKICRQPLR